MKPSGDVFDRIRSVELTGKKRHVAKYILDNHVEASFLTAAQLAERAQVSEPTVIRLAYDLGFRGFPALKDALQEEVQAQLNTVQRLRRSRRRLRDKSPALQSLSTELQNLDALLASLDTRCVRAVAQLLLRADKVIVVGYKMSSVLARYLHAALKKCIDNTVAVTEATGQLQEELIAAGATTVLIGISFPRYTMAAVRGFRQAKAQGVHTVAITDSELSPLGEHAEHILLAPCRAVSYVDAFAAAIALLGALVTELSMASEEQLLPRLSTLETLWEEDELFS
jgi:DNA-binding MurR/RpiR family transcriptional regulator